MKITSSFFLAIFLFGFTSFGQSAKKLEQNLNVTVTGYFNSNSTISFDRKNPKKHGWDYVTEKFEKSFSSKGFNIGKSNTNISHYVFVIDYDYGYLIAAYKMQYSNLRGTIIDLNNNSQPIGTFTYTGRYENDEVADAIATKLSTIIKDPIHNKQPQTNQTVKSKEDRLKELKDLLDKGLITQDDYNTQKTKILNEN